MVARGNPLAVRSGPGKLYIGPIGSTEPTALLAALDAAWILLGYTEEGSNFIFDNGFEDVMVAEEYEPINILQTTRNITINMQLAELTATNLQRAFNGGTIVVAGALTTFEPLPAGSYTPTMLLWESEDGMERWIFRRCIQVGSLDIGRKKAPTKAILAVSFRCTRPTNGTTPTFKVIHDTDYTLPLT